MNWISKQLLRFLRGILLTSVTVTGVMSGSAWSDEPETIRIGVLAYRGKAQALSRWSPTAEYLSSRVAGYQFEIVPVDLHEITDVIKKEKIQFTLTNPGNYVDLETRFGVSRIATLQTRAQDRIRVRYGAVIITRADNTEIRTLPDLKGKSFMAVSAEAFGGFQMAWCELNAQSINPFKDFSTLEFAGFPQDKIVMAVRNGSVDAATVRSETLARMIESGMVDGNEFFVLNQQQTEDSPYPLSTRLYPEWPFAMLRDTPRQLSTKVAQALLSMPADHPAAQASRTAGWTVPLDYSPVHDLMRTLQIGPYEALHQTSLVMIIKRHIWWFIAAGAALLLLLFLNGYISRTNHRLKDTQRNLKKEIVERERSQAALARYRDTLEEQVADRTEDLRTTNQALEKSRVALSELVRITSAPELSHDEKLARLLDTGREYYGLPIAVLTSVEQTEQPVFLTSGNPDLAPGHPGPLNARCAAELLKRGGDPLDIPDLLKAAGSDSACVQQGWRSYLGAGVLVDGRIHCTLEFVGTEAREKLFSQWDHDLLKVMAQWIGDELERQMAYESEQRHQTEFARVSRMSTIGEMAASLAHELNQPLTGAINYSNGCLRLLRSGDGDTGKLVEGMERAVEGATLAADIIRHIREFVQKGESERVPMDLNDAVKNVCSLVNFEARRHGVEIVLDLETDLPPIYGNPIQLEQVILNFIRNGIDAMEIVDAGERKLTISTRLDGESVRVIAADTGEGITDQSLEKIFDTFYTTKPDGMGIGLSISRSIIESHHGKVLARSLPDKGAEFSFEIPLAKAV